VYAKKEQHDDGSNNSEEKQDFRGKKRCGTVAVDDHRPLRVRDG
jgi:hypothetical protein